MLKNQAEQFEHHAKELQEALSKNPRVDAWVVAKAERAATDLSDITHYLEGENNIHTNGDGEDVIKMDVPLFIRSQEYAREDAKSDADIHEFTDNAIDLSQSGETLEMDDYKKLVPNHMARGGVNFGASFEKFKKQVLPINIETRSEVDANTILKYADLQNVPATLKSIGDLFVVILDKPLEIRDSMEGRIKELLKGKSYAKGGKVSSFFSKAKEKYVQAKDYTKKQIKDKKKQIALEVIDNTKDKVSGNKQKMLLKSVEQIVEDNYARGGATFQDKVDAIAPDLVGKEVPKRLRKDYGKKYNKKEALEAARRIAGSMRAKEMKKGKK